MKKYLYAITALLVLSTANSCKKILDININPNAPTSVDASTLLPPMLAGMARGVWYDSRYVSQYAQMWGYISANNVWDQEGYAPGTDSGGEMWRTVYFSLGQNVTLMWQDANAHGKNDYIGVGWALRAWGWQTGGDLYNNMIVKEAFDPSRLTFDYDSPQDVYAEVVKDCQLSLNYLNLAIKNGGVTSASLAKGDYMYSGNLSLWVKFVYSILAQNALHQSNKSTFNPDLVKKYVDSSFVSNAENASVQCNGSQSGDSNFWGPTRANLGSYRQSDYMVRLLDGRIFTGATTQNLTADPRLPLLLVASKDGAYRGVIPPLGDPNTADANTAIPQFAGQATISATSATAAKYLFNDNSRGVLMTYPVLQFMKAEALYKKGDLSGAYASYINGVKGALDFASNPPVGTTLTGSQKYISDAAIAAYLTGPSVRQSAATLKLSDILQQKFIALFLWNPLEAWADERRYSYDTNMFQGFTVPGTLYPDNAGKQVYLIRPRYNSEYIWNVPALRAIGALDPDYHTKKPWFILP